MSPRSGSTVTSPSSAADARNASSMCFLNLRRAVIHPASSSSASSAALEPPAAARSRRASAPAALSSSSSTCPWYASDALPVPSPPLAGAAAIFDRTVDWKAASFAIVARSRSLALAEPASAFSEAAVLYLDRMLAISPPVADPLSAVAAAVDEAAPVPAAAAFLAARICASRRSSSDSAAAGPERP